MRFWKKTLVWIPSDLLEAVDVLGKLSGAESLQVGRKRVMLLAVKELMQRVAIELPEVRKAMPKDMLPECLLPKKRVRIPYTKRRTALDPIPGWEKYNRCGVGDAGEENIC